VVAPEIVFWTRNQRLCIIRRKSKLHTRKDDGMGQWMRRAGWFFFLFDGRIGRLAYLGGGIVVTLLFMELYYVMLAVIPWSTLPDWIANTDKVLYVAIAAAAPLPLWISWAIAVKRAHDFKRSWGTVLLLTMAAIIPIVQFATLAPIFIPGTRRPNEYGAGAGWKNRPPRP
jgi:uncharacterized membrane protein YhaH (DUF805 family)